MKPLYVHRLERHYGLVKQAAADPQHPAYERLQTLMADDAASFHLQSARKVQKGSRKGKSSGKGRRR